MAEKHYIDEQGTEIIVDCGCDISGSTNLVLKIKKPDSTKVSWTPEIFNTNYLRYVVKDGDFNLAGTYYLQASLSTGIWIGLGETATFKISNAYD